MHKFLILFLTVFLSSSLALADDKADLEKLLTDFLAGQTEQHHANFWAEELVYTSSNGTRFGKAEIMAGFDGSDQQPSQTPKVTYSGTEIDIRVYGEMAIVAFKLLATEGGVVTQTYFNTGTFHKKSGKWQAVAWQATKIPKQD